MMANIIKYLQDNELSRINSFHVKITRVSLILINFLTVFFHTVSECQAKEISNQICIG